MKYLYKLKNKIFLRDGHFILIAQLIDKVVNFIIMLLAARYMNISTYGNFSYVKSIVVTLASFAGLGGNHALLRFGMDTGIIKEKYTLLYSALFFGGLFSLVLIFCAYFFIDVRGEIKKMFNIYIFFILFYYLFDTLQNFYRIQKDNKSYALQNIKYSLSVLLFGSLALFYFGAYAFILVIAIMPLVYVILGNITRIKRNVDINFHHLFWKYGFFIAIGTFLNQFFLQADILVLGYLEIDTKLIAQYKVATLIIYVFLFIPNAFLVRDFAHISENSTNKEFLLAYIFEYLQYAGVILLIVIPTFYYLSGYLLTSLFGLEYLHEDNLQNILIFSVLGLVLLRMPFGNILNAVGEAKLNVYNAVITVVLAIYFLLILTKNEGIVGTAYAMVWVTSISGIISLGMFLYYISTLKNTHKI